MSEAMKNVTENAPAEKAEETKAEKFIRLGEYRINTKSVFYNYVKEKELEQAAHGVSVSPDAWGDGMYLLHLR
jgi:hypothetical protein